MKCLTIYLFGLLLFTSLISCDESAKASAETSDTAKMSEEDEMKARVEKGQYLVSMIGCDDCHTPKKMTEKGPVPDMDKRLMGHPADMSLPPVTPDMHAGQWMYMAPTLTAAVGPWGTSYAANITSDETGIGNWSYENFKNAMTKGMHKGMENTRPIMPPMPWQAFKEMKEEDLKSIYAYLQSTKPIANVVPAYTPPPVENE